MVESDLKTRSWKIFSCLWYYPRLVRVEDRCGGTISWTEKEQKEKKEPHILSQGRQRHSHHHKDNESGNSMFKTICCQFHSFYVVLKSSLFGSSTLGHKMSPSLLPAVLLFSVEPLRSCFKILWPHPPCLLFPPWESKIKTFSLPHSLSKREPSLIEEVFIRFPLC